MKITRVASLPEVQAALDAMNMPARNALQGVLDSVVPQTPNDDGEVGHDPMGALALAGIMFAVAGELLAYCLPIDGIGRVGHDTFARIMEGLVDAQSAYLEAMQSSDKGMLN